MDSFRKTTRQDQLKETDVRDIAGDQIDPSFFLSQYVKSNFPQTISSPSQMQKEGLVPTDENRVKLTKQMSSSDGIGFDRPQNR